jgi:uncharacterized protein YdeI (YjbR/CyaY-like superfamily)
VEDFPNVDAYLAGSSTWADEIRRLRPLLSARLDEGIKWGKPCYSREGANVVILQEFNDLLSLMFFKGVLLDDPDGLLVEQGPNSRSAKRLEIQSVEDVDRLADSIGRLVDSAIDVEERGVELPAAPELELVEELRERLDADPALKAAFEALTPGRQREYHLFISGAKQSATRQARIEKNVARILEGKGLRDR